MEFSFFQSKGICKKIYELITYNYFEYQKYLKGCEAYFDSTNRIHLETDKYNLFLKNSAYLN